MLGACCCSEPGGEEVFKASAGGVLPAFDGAVMLRPVSQSGNASEELPAQPVFEERESEKARLKVLVNQFANKASKGCPCSYFSEATGERIETTYRLRWNLSELTIVSPKDSSETIAHCPLATIQDIYTLSEDGESCFPAKIVKAVRPEEQDRLVLVVYQGGQILTFLEESIESRDRLLECLRILCIYARASVVVTDGSRDDA
mmetsp:Transcript_17790/g.46952  ORF Transcript_17790/g.46952 Transcript_17790/m.46952 type:complete len:203 (-) Transcript_17790:403-1011(-)